MEALTVRPAQNVALSGGVIHAHATWRPLSSPDGRDWNRAGGLPLLYWNPRTPAVSPADPLGDARRQRNVRVRAAFASYSARASKTDEARK